MSAIHPKLDLKSKSRSMLEFAFALAIAVHMGLFLLYPRFVVEAYVEEDNQIKIHVEDIPQTEQIKRPPPPPRPSVPIESEDENLLDDVTIEDTEFFDFDDVPPPPPGPSAEEEEIPPFLPLEDQPQIKGGLSSLNKYMRYPEIAKKAGVEGLVMVAALIGKDGKVEDIRVEKSIGAGCDEEAVRVIRDHLEFSPAKQRGKAVKFWFRIPVRFSLKGAK